VKSSFKIIVLITIAVSFTFLVGITCFSWKRDPQSYLLAVVVSVALMAIVFPLRFYGEKFVKIRWQAVGDFIRQHEGQIAFCAHTVKRNGDIVVPVFCGFLFDGGSAYVLLEPKQDRQKALMFIRGLQEVCLANNSWHFDCFKNRLSAWLHYRRAKRAFGDA
jgi:hypothetical protein